MGNAGRVGPRKLWIAAWVVFGAMVTAAPVGTGPACAAVPPDETGACCFDGGCEQTTALECDGGGGVYQGDGADCTVCPQPICELPGDPCSDCGACTCAPEVNGGLPDGVLTCVDTLDCLLDCATASSTLRGGVVAGGVICEAGCLDNAECPTGYACVDPIVVLPPNGEFLGGVCCATVTTVTVTTSTTTTSTTLPPNDGCRGAEEIAGCEITVPFDTTGATTDGLPHAACLSVGQTQVYNDVWYCWEAPFDASVAVETCGGTGLDSRLNVYGPFENCELAALECPAGDGDLLDCNDDACGLQSRVEFGAEAGKAYLVRLGSYNSTAQGSGTFDVTCQEQVELCTGEPGGVCQVPNPTSNGVNAVLSVPGLFMAADDFTPVVSAEITHLGWWGIYGRSHMGPPTDCGPGAGDNFRVTYYADAGGLPGAVVAGPMPLMNVAKCETGASVQYGPNTFAEYQYEGDHAPVAVEAGATYWVEISNATVDPECRWSWRTSDEGNGGFAVNPGDAWEAATPDLAFCYNTIRQTCRSAGYYMTHSSTEGGARDVTGELLAAAGCLEICGEVIRSTMVNDADSAVEALCDSSRGTPERQLARQLTALGLNCIASGYGPLCRGWPEVEQLFAECNMVCEFGENAWTVDECIAAAACVNNGGDPFATPGACFNGTCSDNGEPCSVRDKQNCADPILATCEPLAETCHDRDICNAGVGVCVEPGTPANPTSCKMAKMSACSILEVGRTTENDCDYGVRLDDESCCNDPAECDDGELCTEDQCVVGPGCSNTPIPLCCESNADCTNPLPTCDLSVNICMECVKDQDCDDADVCTTDVCEAGSCSNQEIPECCRDDGECAYPTPRCEPTIHECVQCLDDGDCADPTPYCGGFFGTMCVECQGVDDCVDGIDCTFDLCVGPGVCVNPEGPVAPPGLCEQNCRCEAAVGRVCDPVPGCCVTDADCTDPAASTCLPDNTCGGSVDACELPGTIDCGGSVTFDNTGFTTVPSDPTFSCRIGGPAQGVGAAWYTFVATSSSACLDTNSSAVSDTLLAVYDGTCGSFVELACDDDDGDGFKSALCVDGLTPGNTYYVQVASYSAGSLGSITLDLVCEVCGDGIVTASEGCDDGGTVSGDGCDDGCMTEPGWDCTGEPSVCQPVCGDGIVIAPEGCDDGGTVSGDGCDDGCMTEPGYECTGEPSICQPICGDTICLPQESDGPGYCGQDCCPNGFCSRDEESGMNYCEQDCCGDGICSFEEEEFGQFPCDLDCPIDE